MFSIERYTEQHFQLWNEFVYRAKNTSFLFDRHYMDYHSHRFTDFSLLFFIDKRLYAILPANVEGDTLHSHQGLTYGGVIMNEHTTVSKTITLFHELNHFLHEKNIKKVIYKAIPYIFHLQPSEEDLYALWRMKDIRLVGRDVGTVIENAHINKLYRIRERGVKRAKQANIQVEETKDFAPFWQILTQNLQERYKVNPVHSLNEITLLHNRFPKNILHYIAKQENEPLAGVVLYITPQVVHVQYIAANAKGKELGALDLIFYQLITQQFQHIRYFDFGRSTEDDGTYLNESLIYQKEGFGGRAVCWDKYEWNL